MTDWFSIIKEDPYPKPGIKPIGTWAGRRLAMLGDIPHYKSSGTSGSGPNNDQFKEKGSWYPFYGIEPEGHKQGGNLEGHRGNWMMKFPNLTDHERTPAYETDFKTPSKIGQWMSRHEPNIPEEEWGEGDMDDRAVNEALLSHGWDADKWRKGDYPEEQPPPFGSLRWQIEQRSRQS